ncbi:hypothetical protein FHW02_004330 [Ochrobactrum sp. RH1CCR137]|nr:MULTISPECIES: hypothetical protein [unclassified Ochrobactrum]MBA8846240.1 hypothetical protein [Ochrobactrum sp. RH1CCR137]MBA8858059.1 hypothetical protein [Ochrobactrum sp. RH1CCR134]
MSRWVRVQTSIFDHELFQAEPLTEREAWLWLIANAAWKATRHRIGTDMHEVPAGSLFVTLRQLQAAWKWKSDYRVRSFLKLLEKEEMIVCKTNAGKTQVSICNYSHYQEAERTENASATQEKRTKDTSTPITSSLRSDVSERAKKQDHVSEALEAYSALASRCGLPAVRVLNDARKRKLASLLKAHGLPVWLEALAKVEASDFCLGRKGDFRADLDFLLQQQSFTRLLEGRYDNRASAKPSEPPPKPRNIGDAIRDEARRLGVLKDEPVSENRGFHDEGHSAGNVRVLDLAFRPSLKGFG